MRAVQIVELTGPESALAEADVPEPEASHVLTPGSGVVVDVHAAGVSFPEVLQTRGEYQVKPPLPFVPGSEVAGTVRSAPEGAGVQAGGPGAPLSLLGRLPQGPRLPRARGRLQRREGAGGARGRRGRGAALRGSVEGRGEGGLGRRRRRRARPRRRRPLHGQPALARRGRP